MTDELSKEPAFKGLTLGNEVNQLSDRPHPTKMSATDRQIDAWLDALLPTAAGEGTTRCTASTMAPGSSMGTRSLRCSPPPR